MKNNLLKFYIVAFYFCSTFIAFAQPGGDDEGGGLEGGDPLPIDNSIWVLVAVGMLFVFLRLRFLSEQNNNLV